MFKNILENIQNKKPLIHNITNYVTVNDCANMLLACGGSPIMADDSLEVEEITTICDGLVINVGTLNSHTIESMILAGKKANQINHPVILDPVGIGASKLRTETVKRLLKEIRFTVIRGNVSEIKAISMESGKTKGVDALDTDKITDENINDIIQFAKTLSEETGAIIVMTGAIDIISDKKKAFVVRNGHPIMSKITGTGCMLTSILGAYCTANQNHLLDAAAAAVCSMGICGEMAYEKMVKMDGGTSSYKMYLIDSMSNFTSSILERKAKIEVINIQVDDLNKNLNITNITKESLLLYAVTDRTWLKDNNLSSQVEQAIQGGATCIQLREKHISFDEYCKIAIEVKEITDQYHIPFIINDNIDVAIAVNADGVHIGQNDMDITIAREKLGSEKIIGVSAHTVEEAISAQNNGANYIGVGAVFQTSTKKDTDLVSSNTLKDICDSVNIPVVAIGGIKKDNILMLAGSGIDGVAVVSAIFAQPDVRKAANKMSLLSEIIINKDIN